MAILPVTLGDVARLALTLEDGNATQFPQARVYTPGNGTPIAVRNLSHTVDGLYESSFTPQSVGVYNIVYTVFRDESHNNLNRNYSREMDQILCQAPSNMPALLNEIIDKLVRMLGLEHENSVIDNTTYDDCAQMTASRVRLYDSAATASAATDGGNETAGLIATYQVTAEYDGPAKLRLYRMVRL